MIKPFETLCDEVNAAGWLVLNCFQISQDHWRANVQRRDENGTTLTHFTEFADGKTASDAMRACLFNINQPRNAARKPAASVLNAKTGKAKTELTPKQAQRLAAAFERLTAAFDKL